jgi:antitoxin MazE
MGAFVKKWGNSAAVRIPSAVLDEAGMEIDQPIMVREDRGRIIIEPVRRKVFAIDDLIKGIHPGNLPEPIDTGPRKGGEVW